ncbi:hypothetical protein [Gordonia sp. (in: high G+C Gram-positive bacteria)]|uniref:hypothetical protein n=1 Tax=Gordonia sp. (in: high G+C Gram-positive bacteria) TaxID=84139 RepID=UPI001D1CBF7A|nr:hypothetical protein [Gordonia sp. (in: high G+C Gram-positive bacteria)]MCB1294210.1 hypothetical protein [Gordonia sp. (in: high G+C Gram-positive bacteria)]HMS75894.1 hypothetical protein [Gordonia sp. (in: high G+C Gram-positive bacteria)]HQV17625.1 hypothetical protein [Gordonia sp. (in: high G+C Gram-positive bacteria)]
MERLEPPVIPAPEPPPSIDRFIVGPEGIGRNELLKQWRGQMTMPRPTAGKLPDELHGWAGKLGACDWFGPAYYPSLTVFMRKQRLPVADRATLTAGLAACADLVEPLSRYSVGWCDTLMVLNPVGWPKDVLLAVREGARKAPGAVRELMVVDGVIATQNSAGDFVRDQTRRHRQDTRTSLQAYLHHLRRIRLTGNGIPRELADDEKATLSERFSSLVRDYGVEPADELSENELAELRRLAKEFLDAIIDKQVVERERNSPLAGEAYERVLTTYVNRLSKGMTLAGTEWMFRSRIEDARKDKYIRHSKQLEHETPLTQRDDPDDSGTRDNAVAVAPPAQAEPTDMMSIAADFVRTDPAARLSSSGELCWEASLAIDFLLGRTTSASGPRLFRREIQSLWSPDIAAECRFSTAAGAAGYVAALIEGAVNRAIRELRDGTTTQRGDL